MGKKQSLYEEMKQFQHKKKYYLIGFFVIGLVGLVIPIIPGLVLIWLGISLISPKNGEELYQKLKDWLKSMLRF